METSGRSWNRRNLLRAAGGIGIAAAAGALWRAVDQDVFDAGGNSIEPWQAWRGEEAVGPLALVHAAILAASPHNTQPWLFRVEADRIELFADESRNLGAIDGERREMQIGLGCALENLLLAAPPHGLRAEVRFPDASDPAAPVAVVALDSVPTSSSALFEAIPHRHTNRGPYRLGSPLSTALLDELERLAGDLPDARLAFWRSEADRRAFARETLEASRAIVADDEQAHASASWIRFDADEIERHRDGLGVDALGLPPLVAGLLKMLPSPNRKRIDDGWLRATEEVHTATAPLFGAVLVRDPGARAQRLAAGRLWQRVHLLATARGVAGQPLSQLVERRDREVELGLAPRFGDVLRTLVGDADWHAVLPFRLGYPERAAPPSPRREVSSVLL